MLFKATSKSNKQYADTDISLRNSINKKTVKVKNTISFEKKGSLIIEQGGKFSESEKKAAEYMCKLGKDVVLRTPKGTRINGGTSDLLVNGINYDVYTPITTNPSRIISAIAAKKDQATGIVLDLSQTSVTLEQLGDIKSRLIGKGVNNISDIVILKQDWKYIMPKIVCSCQNVLSYSEIPCSIEYKFISDVEYDKYQEKINAEDLYQNMQSFLKCPQCNHLWIFWYGYASPPTEYKRIDDTWKVNNL